VRFVAGEVPASELNALVTSSVTSGLVAMSPRRRSQAERPGLVSSCRRLAVEVRLKSSVERTGESMRRLAIGDVAQRAGTSASRIRYYEARGLLPEPEREAGKRRYGEDVFRRLAIIAAAQRVGFTLDEIGDLLGSRDELAHERLRQLALMKLPELDDLIARATSVRRVLRICSRCSCESIDVCRMFDDRVLPLRDPVASHPSRRSRGRAPVGA
jgi:DNA-binding transcriptional MerR regulator